METIRPEAQCASSPEKVPEIRMHVEEILRSARDVRARVSKVVSSLVGARPPATEQAKHAELETVHTLLSRTTEILGDILEEINRL